MKKEHKDNIDRHLERCIDETDFNKLFTELVRQRLFNQYMQDEIMNEPEQSRTRFMYNYIKTRGPDAYDVLVTSLNNIGHIDLALLFDHRFFRPAENQNPAEDGADGIVNVMRKAIDRMDLRHPMTVYHMGSNPKGLALIINMNTFVNNIHEERGGAKLDVERLQQVLPALGYEVLLHQDLSYTEFAKEIDNFARREDHSNYDSCIVVVMTHGTAGAQNLTVDLFSHDGRPINSQDIVSQFYGYKSKHLVGKPKMFFFQACRGVNMDHAVTPPPARRAQTDGYLIRASYPREVGDIFYVFPCAPDGVALRSTDEGSWFIQELCNTLCTKAWNTDLENILKEVDRNLQNRYDVVYGKTCVCANSIGFNKNLYFNPGLYDSSKSQS